MKKTFLIALKALFLSTMAYSQAAGIPTAWDFDSPQPTGWTYANVNSGNLYYAGGQSGQAFRIDADGDYLQIEFNSQAGPITYYLKGQSFQSQWDGEMRVQESVNGNNWTTLHAYIDADISNSAFVFHSDTPATSTRFIRFYYTDKISGYNLAIDSVYIATPLPSNLQEINIFANSNTIPDSTQLIVGTASATQITIENLNLVTGNTLNINSITLSGTHAAQFGLSNIPTQVAAASSQNFTLNFTPSGNGSRFCTVTISSNDANGDETAYEILVYGIAGSYATQPADAATNLTFSNLKSWDFDVNFSPGATQAEHYIVFYRKNNPATALPVDGLTYKKGQWVGTSKVAYVGNAGTFNAKYILANTAYNYTIYAYNGPPGYENYLTTNTLTGNISTPGGNIQNTYSGIVAGSTTFLSDLHNVVNPSNYNQIYYANYIGTLINEFYVKDTLLSGTSTKAIECQYSGFHDTYTSSFVWWGGSGSGDLSREHVYAKSWMPTVNDPGFDGSYEYSDMHNLLPVNQTKCNAVRSNNPFGEVVSPISTYMNAKYGLNSNGLKVYEPRESIKGDVARALFYHITKYTDANNDFSLPEQISFTVQYGQDEYILKKWHFNDLPNPLDIARNDYIAEQQNNRNPFTDSTRYVCFIRFADFTLWKPLIDSIAPNTFKTDTGIFIQWYIDGNPVAGATSPVFSPQNSGVLTVKVQQFAQCPTFTSAPYSPVGIEPKDVIQAKLWPNPAQNTFKLSFTTQNGEKAKVRIINLEGKTVWSKTYNTHKGANTLLIPAELAAGAYQVNITIGQAFVSKALVVQ